MSPSGGVGIDEYAVTGLPSGLNLDTGTGAIGGTPDTADANTADVTVTVSDAVGNTAEVPITFPAVAKGDQTLTGFQYSASSVAFGSAAPTVTAPGGVETTLSYSATPASVCSVDASGALTLEGAGECVITATAAGTDDYNEATADFTLTVQATGTLALTLDVIAGDDKVNIAEKAAGFSIGGNTGSEGGVSVTVTVDTTELTTTSADTDPATWSVSVAADATYITGTSLDVEVNATKTGFTAPATITRTLTVDLTAPTAPTYTAPASLKVGVPITEMSPSGGVGIDEYAVTGLPSGLNLDTGTGAIGGTPDTADANTADVTVTVSDAAGNTAEVPITFPAVAKGDQTLTGFQYSASSVAFGSAAPTVTAPGGVETTVSYSATPLTVCTVEPTSGTLTLEGVGSCVITATAAGTDDYNEATATFTVTVQAVGTLSLNLDAIVTDNKVNIAEKAAGFTITGDTGTESGVSVTVEIGTATLPATSADDSGTATWSVSVAADASYISGTSVDVEVNATKTGFTAPSAVERTLAVDLTAPTAPTYTAPASLKVGVPITEMSPSGGVGIDEYAVTGLPSGLNLDTGTGAIGGTPDTADANTADVTVTVSDAAGNTAEVPITFPAVAKGDQTLTGFQYSASSVAFGSAAPTVTAPGGVETTVSYSATPLTVCTVEPTSGTLTLEGVGSCVITATAAGTDHYNEATATFTVTVQAVGTLSLNLDTIAGDDTVNIDEKAAGFSISGDTGSEGGVGVTVTVDTTELTTTSADTDPATWSVSVAADATYITGTSVDVTVSATKTGFTAPGDVQRTLTVDLTAPTAPTYTAPGSLKVGEAIAEMSPSGGVGIDEYAVTGLPSGLSLDTGTGAIGGTPDTADANTADVTVTVSDAAGNTAEVPITFPAVAKGDQTLTGFQYSASSVAFGSAAPTVTAPGGVETTVSYLATPLTVCTVEPTSGTLTLEGVGSCVITATAAGTDDYNEATATFTVTVQAVGTLSLNLDAIVTDNKVNIAEKAAGFTITGDTGTESGVSVTVEIGTATLPATSADDSGTATWSVSVAADASYISGTSVDVEVNATKTGFTAPSAVERTLTVDLTAPTAPTYTAPASLKVGVPITEMSPSGGVGIDEYAVTGLPSGLNLDTGTGAIGGTPDTADANTADVTVTVSDAAGNTAEVPITFPAVTKGDQTLTGFQYSASSVTFGSAAPTVTAPGGVETTLSYSATPASVCSVDASGALTLEGAGECVITATAAGTDDYNEATADFTLTVQAVGALAVTLDAIAGDDTVNIAEKAAGFTISGNTGSEGGVSVTVTVDTTELTTTSADTDPATWSVSVAADATYITGTSVDVTVSATKTGFTAPGDVQRTLTVDLTAPTAPTYTAPGTLKVGEAIAEMSPSGGVGIDEYAVTGLPSGLSLDTGTGAIGGTPDTADANTASATVTVSDAAGNTVEVPITFPAVTKGDQTLTGFQYSASSVTFGSAAPTVTAPGGVETTLSYSATPASVCSVDASGALTLEGAGECVITATAAGTDDYNEATADFTLTVQATGTLALNLDAIAGDDTVNIAEKAAGFTITGDTGTESGVSVTVEIGTATLPATSADDSGTATWSVSVVADATYITGTSLIVEVNATKTGFTAPAAITRTLTVDLTAPTAPAYTAPGTLKVGEAIAVMNPTGGAGIEEYSATGLPSGLNLDTGTGAIGGTPDTADANTADATVTVSDAAGNTVEVPITFPAVAKGDQTLTGFQYSATSVTFGSAAPTVTAPGGVETTLSYSATPASVCSVDASGALTLEGAGECVITATAAGTDDYNEATADFTLTVQAVGALAVTLDAIAGDDTVNIAEKVAGFTISGNTGSEGGVSVTVTVDTTELTTTSADTDPATWSVSVAADATYITGTSVDVTVSATKTGFTAPGDVQRTLTVDLTAPTAPTYTAPGTLKVGEAIAEMSPSGGVGIDEYAVTGLPSGLSLDTGTGAIGGTPDTADANTASATVTVSDAAGNTVEVPITFPAVTKGDQTLTGFQYSASSVTFGSAAPTVTAPGGVETTLSYSATPASVCSVDASGALTLEGAGECVITATAAGTDDYNEATADFTLTVQATGTLALNLDAIATDDTVNIAEKAAGFTITGDTGSGGGVSVTVTVGTTELTAISADTDPATWSVSVAADATYITGTSLVVEVNASKTGFTAPSAITRTLTVDLTAPTAPSYTAPLSLKVGEAITAMNPTGGAGVEEYSATGLPSGLSLDTGTGAIGGTPDTADANTADATVTVSDAAGNTVEVPITFPAVAKGDQTLTGFQYSSDSVILSSAAPTVTAPSGVQTTLSYSATPLTVCTVEPSSGALTLEGAGECVITATAAGTDDYNEATADFTLTVQATGTLALTLDVIAGDDTVNIAEKAAGFSIGGNTGSEGGVSVTVTVGTTELTSTSAAADPATWSVSVPADATYISGTSVDVTVSATKTGFTAPGDVQRTLTVDLTAPTAPSYTAPLSLKVGEAITAMNPTGGAGIEEYSATGLPSGLSLDTGTGAIGGTPDTADANTVDATVTVSDTAGNTATVDIAFPAVDKGDQTLTGFQYSASSVTFGSAAPTVTAPGGVQTTLSYSATPAAVCAVDPSSGALTLAGAGECVVTATAAGTDNYNEATATYTVTVNDDGTVSSAVALSVNPDSIVEGAGATTVIVTGALNGIARDEPTTLTLSVGAPEDTATEGIDYTVVNDVALTIDAGQTSGTATFTLTPTDDGVVEGDETLTVSGTTSDEDLAVTGTGVTILDDDERGVLVNPTSLTVSEGDSATYTVVLGSRPSGTVRVTISGTTGTDLRRSRSFLSFRTSNWNEPQTVTVTARQDEDAEDDTVTISHAVSGADYEANGVTVDAVSVTIDDDDRVSTGVDLSVSHRSFEEDASFTGVIVTGTLNGIARAEPTTVTVSVGASEDAATEGTDYVAVDDLGLTIPAGQASATAIFVFKPTDDLIDEPAEAVSITGATGVADFEVTGTTLVIKDNDERGVTVSPTDLALTEGGSATYTVVLNTEPTETVTVTPSVSGRADVTVSAALTFTATDWGEAQTVTVTAAQDADAGNDKATIGHAVSGADYGANSATADDVSVTVDDDETAVLLTVNPTAVDEVGSGTGVTVTGTLDGVTRDEPTTVTVSVGASDDAAIAGTDYVAVDDLSLTIPSGEASATASFTFTPLEDRIDERVEAVSITGTTEAVGFAASGTTLSITDNDERGVTVSPSDLSVSEGASATYTVVLDTEPTGTVTVTPSLGSGDTDVTVSGALTFTATDWDRAQTVTVSAAQDTDAANDTATIEHAVSGADYGDNGATADDVSVTVEDDETAVTLTVDPAAVDEDGGGTTVTVTARSTACRETSPRPST